MNIFLILGVSILISKGAVDTGAMMVGVCLCKDLKHDSGEKMSHYLLPLDMEEDARAEKRANQILSHEEENT